MKIPKDKIQSQMDYFSLHFFHRGEAGMRLAWAMLKQWVDTYDVPEVPEEPEIVGSSYKEYLDEENYKAFG